MGIFKAFSYFCLVALCVSNSDADGKGWYNFKVRFDLLPFKGFFDMPRTLSDAEKDDWTLIDDGCEAGSSSRYPGKRMWNLNSIHVILIFDANGYIAGTQSVVPKKYTDPSIFDFDKSKAYNLETIEGEEVYLTTAYFVEPDIICTGRSAEAFYQQGTGHTLYFQNGPTSKDLMEAPYSEEVMATMGEGWYKHYCFINMGNHYFTIDPDNSQDMSCQDIFPAQLVYDHQKPQPLIGFVWQHFANLPGYLWERPDKKAVNAIVHNAPPCMVEYAEKKTSVTLHHYFLDWVETCLF